MQAIGFIIVEAEPGQGFTSPTVELPNRFLTAFCTGVGYSIRALF